MAKYKKNPAAPLVIIPGVGMVAEGQTIEGDYEQYVPLLLQRAAAEAPAPAKRVSLAVPVDMAEVKAHVAPPVPAPIAEILPDLVADAPLEEEISSKKKGKRS